MNALAIEINDAGLVVANRERVLAVEPGYAVVDGGEIALGSEAYAQARIKPRLVNNRFWSELSLDPDSAAFGGIRNSAELAFLQLEALWQRFKADAGRVVLLVPGHYDAQQLGILLGLAQECAMPVLAMVDMAVAASRRAYPGRQLIYADSGLHRVSVTALEQGDEVAAQSEQALASTGIAALNDSLAKRLAEIFVLETRFDPFHDAHSEQRLYDCLPDWLRLLHEAETAELRLAYRDEEFSIEVRRDQLLGVAAGFYKALLQLIAQSRQGASGLVVQLSDRLARLPGLNGELSRLDDALVVGQAPGHAALAVLQSLDELGRGNGQVKLLRHLKWREVADAAPRVAPKRAPPPSLVADDDAPRPTHVVYRGFAYPVDGGLMIGRSKTAGRRGIVIDDQAGGVSRSHCELSIRDGELMLRDLSSYGTFVNERRVAGEAALRPADIIRIGSPGAELQVVAVEDGDGA